MSRKVKVSGTVGGGEQIANVDFAFYNWTATAKYFSDEFVTEVTPTAGTVTIYGRVPGAGANALFSDAELDATDPAEYATAGSPLESVTAVPDGIVGATHFTVTIIGTE